MSKIAMTIVNIMFIFQPRMNTQAELYTSTTDIGNLVHTEEKVIRDLEQYVAKQTKRLNFMQSVLDQTSEAHTKLLEDPRFLLNPINALRTMNRVSKEWRSIKSISKDRAGYLRDWKITYPTMSDAKGAAAAFGRMQTTYRMKIIQLANGTLMSNFSPRNEIYTEYTNPLSACDCYFMSGLPANLHGYSGQVSWLKTALVKLRQEQYDFCQLEEKNILYKISEAYFNLKYYKESLEWLKAWLVVAEPSKDRDTGMTQLRDLQEKIDNGEGYKTKKEKQEAWKQPKNPGLKGCRKNIKPLFRNRHLKCSIISFPMPGVGMKVELLSRSPYIAIVYDILSEVEIEALKALAKAKLVSAPVQIKQDIKINDKIPNTVTNDDDRVAKKAVLGIEWPEVRRVIRRVGYAVASNANTAPNKLEVYNYGIAGHYSEHIDNFNADRGVSNSAKSNNSVLATMIFLSDVKQGGAIVIRNHKVKIYPPKASMLVYDVTYPSGDIRYGMRSTLCPIIRGLRYIALSFFENSDFCYPWFFGTQMITKEMYSKWFE